MWKYDKYWMPIPGENLHLFSFLCIMWSFGPLWSEAESGDYWPGYLFLLSLGGSKLQFKIMLVWLKDFCHLFNHMANTYYMWRTWILDFCIIWPYPASAMNGGTRGLLTHFSSPRGLTTQIQFVIFWSTLRFLSPSKSHG